MDLGDSFACGVRAADARYLGPVKAKLWKKKWERDWMQIRLLNHQALGESLSSLYERTAATVVRSFLSSRQQTALLSLIVPPYSSSRGRNPLRGPVSQVSLLSSELLGGLECALGFSAFFGAVVEVWAALFVVGAGAGVALGAGVGF